MKAEALFSNAIAPITLMMLRSLHDYAAYDARNGHGHAASIYDIFDFARAPRLITGA